MTAYAEVIGDPIKHSKSPLIHGFWLQKLGIVADYRVHHVLAEDLATYFDNRSGDPDWRGCNNLRVLLAKGHQKITRQVGEFVPAKRDCSAFGQQAVVVKKLRRKT